MIPRPRVVDTRAEAKKIRETFMDRPAQKEARMPFAWPSSLVEVGRCLAVMYTSDKWKKTAEFEDYKHVAEAPQGFYVVPGWLTREDTRQKLRVHGPTVDLIEPMPNAFAVLAPLLGIQASLYVSGGSRPRMGRGNEGVVEIHVTRGMLGGARHPSTGQAFLLIYTEETSGLHAIVTGRALDVEKDGIVG